MTNEYMVKWFLFWDALTRNRTDGALVRLVTYIKPGQNIQEAETQLISFAITVSGQLASYMPE
jgi:hypothetical protein